MIIEITVWSLKKIHHSIFEYLNNKVWSPCPLKSMVISILLNIGTVIFFKTLHPVLITKMIIFQIRLLNETNFFLIFIYLLLQLKIVHVFPLKFL